MKNLRAFLFGDRRSKYGSTLLRTALLGLILTSGHYRRDLGSNSGSSVSAVDLGPMRLRSATLVPLPEGAGPYERLRLRVEMDVADPSSVCSWRASISDSAGFDIAYVQRSADVGGSVCTFELDIAGGLIRNSSKNGPYHASWSVDCGEAEFSKGLVAQTQVLAAAQFLATAYTFQLEPDPGTLSVTRGSSAVGTIKFLPVPGYEDEEANFSIVSSPAALQASLGGDWLKGEGFIPLRIVTTSATPHGTYPVTVRGASGGVVRETTATIKVR